MKVTEEYDAVDALAAVLRDRPLTAAAIARVFNCSRPVAHKRIRALRDRGHQLSELPVREGQSGPMSVAYGLGRPRKRGEAGT